MTQVALAPAALGEGRSRDEGRPRARTRRTRGAAYGRRATARRPGAGPNPPLNHHDPVGLGGRAALPAADVDRDVVGDHTQPATLSNVEQLRVDANGLTFAVLAWGDPAGPLALLLHGYPDTAHTWRHLGPTLAEHGWRAVAPFMRGYAPTDLAPDDSYLLADLTTDALKLHHALGGDERAALIGHDWGAAVGWGVAEVAPDRFAAQACLSAPPPVALLKPFTRIRTLALGARQARMSWYFAFNQLPGAERAQHRVIPKLWRDWSPGYDATQDLGHVFAALRGPGRRRAALRYYRNNLQGGIKATFTGRPRRPVLYLHGQRDGCIAADLAVDALPPGTPFERLAGVGHFPQLENPERVGALIRAWIGSAR
jgi:pimeloyl-ACP methyl ester carboxylesterase